MSHRQDCKHAVLTSLFGNGSMPDLMLQWAQANGATSFDINQATLEALQSNGATSGDLTDAWYEALIAIGITAESRADMEEEFWCVLAGAFSLTAIQGLTGALVDTVVLNKVADFTTPAGGWSFAKTSIGREAIGDINFDTPDNTGPIVINEWTDVFGGVSISGGQMTVDSGTQIAATAALVTLVQNKEYELVFDVESTFTPSSIINITLGGQVAGTVIGPGIHTVTLEATTPLVNQNIGIVPGGPCVLNAISIHEAVGLVEAASPVTSVTTPTADTIEFSTTWPTALTFGDVVVASYDGLGDYEDPSNLVSVGIDGNTDPSFDVLNSWTTVLGTFLVDGNGQAVISSSSVGASPSAITITDGVEYLIDIDIESITGGGGIDISLGGTVVHRFETAGIYTNIPVTGLLPTNQNLAFLTATSGSDAVINSYSIHVAGPKPMEACDVTLTNHLDA